MVDAVTGVEGIQGPRQLIQRRRVTFCSFDMVDVSLPGGIARNLAVSASGRRKPRRLAATGLENPYTVQSPIVLESENSDSTSITSCGSGQPWFSRASLKSKSRRMMRVLVRIDGGSSMASRRPCKASVVVVFLAMG